MLDQLPLECLQHIVSYLPSAKAVVALALVNKDLHAKVSADDYSIFQFFVRGRFPTIKSSHRWRKTALKLTSRSRAWDRKAVVAHEVHPPNFSKIETPRQNGQKFGFTPVIDSYEVDDRLVIAYAAGGKIVTRTTTSKATSWTILRLPDDDQAENDILDLRLLQNSPYRRPGFEHLLYRCATGEISLITASSSNGSIVAKTNFIHDYVEAQCFDVSNERDPKLATYGSSKISIFSLSDAEENVRPNHVLQLQENALNSREHAIKYLSSSTVAVTSQILSGRAPGAIRLYDIDSSTTSESIAPVASMLPEDVLRSSRYSANVLAPLDKTLGSGGQLFLSGWSDGTVRLHDTRTGNGREASYYDAVDDGQILSLLPIGHESFLAGSSQNGCLKTYDMRIPGAKAYSYLNVRPETSPTKTAAAASVPQPRAHRDVNFFLAWPMIPRWRGWKPIKSYKDMPGQRSRYSGSVYSLSAPSASSPTIFAGIQDHVLQLDLVSTDDMKRGTTRALPNVEQLQLSCYERPREGFESTDAVLLHHQQSWLSAGQSGESGWDERWRLASRGKAWSDRPEQSTHGTGARS